jgi:2-oxoglutarate dehydrogenase E1 component
MKTVDKFSYLNSADPGVIEGLYIAYLKDPTSVEESWRKFFDGFEFSLKHYRLKKGDSTQLPSEFRVLNLINQYRQRGHLFTATNPVRARRSYTPTLDIENFGLSQADLDKEFMAGEEVGIGRTTLRNIIAFLRDTYCRSVGVEYAYIRAPEVIGWLRNKMESSGNTYAFRNEDRQYILHNLARAVLFEHFIRKKFPGQKSFSLEGAETLIPALDAIIEKGADLGTKEFVIGMPHRGRLNVLANILKKSYEAIFSEFEGKEYDDETLLGDVKYHLGWTSARKTTRGHDVTLTLSPNPSHLEAVGPVVEGIARARIDHLYGGDFSRVTPILIHGDASIAGQGVVYELVQMSGLKGYRTGGTIHLVVNNQIGFTTNYLDARTSIYCTDVAKVVQSPVFHVNGDDVEAVVYTILLGMEFRDVFGKDVFIDLLCYRKYGHNEGDEPRFTQPILYKIIEKHPNPYEIYRDKLLGGGFITEKDASDLERKLTDRFESSLSRAKSIEKVSITSFLEETWKGLEKASADDLLSSPDTGVEKSILEEIGINITGLPEGMIFFTKMRRLQEARRDMIVKTGVVDWAMAELLAYGSLIREGIHVRISGQDSERGTFSHRHAVLKVEDSEEDYVPLGLLRQQRAGFEIHNSPLSEYAVLGFEYGYSLSTPHALTVWEAQFGDFSNAAQVIFDQFLCCAEEKWNVADGLVVYLPHGFEGQGPEHSSARLERLLTLCAENNMQVAAPSTPAAFFHLLRRQFARKFRKPLIVLTPKSLLRNPRCTSSLDELANGHFREILDDSDADPDQITRLVFCSGKIYYELLEEKEKMDDAHTAIIRIEQPYPFPHRQLQALLGKYHKAADLLWVQEEPVNMGAWPFLRLEAGNLSLRVVARPASGSPATGSSRFHLVQQRKIIEKAFEECRCPLSRENCRMQCIGNRWRTFERKMRDLPDDALASKTFTADNLLI